jgi:ArsR family transcriptional regulator
MRIDEYDIVAVACLHRALADETRLRIVHLLARRGELCVCELESTLEITQSKVSRHLGHLKNAGIVQDRRDGTWVYYRLAAGGEPILRSLLRTVERALASDEVALRDLERARTCRRAPCPPASPAKRGGR